MKLSGDGIASFSLKCTLTYHEADQKWSPTTVRPSLGSAMYGGASQEVTCSLSLKLYCPKRANEPFPCQMPPTAVFHLPDCGRSTQKPTGACSATTGSSFLFSQASSALGPALQLNASEWYQVRARLIVDGIPTSAHSSQRIFFPKSIWLPGEQTRNSQKIRKEAVSTA